MLNLLGLFQSKEYLSIDFSGSAVKVARADIKENSLSLSLTDREPVHQLSENNKIEKYTEALRAIKSRNPISNRENVVFSLPTNSVIVRHVELPSMPNQRLSEVIKYEAESHIPFPIEDVILDHHVLEQTEEETRVLLVVVKNEKLDKYLDVLRNVELRPEMIDISAFSLFNLYQKLKPPEDEDNGAKPKVLVDIGYANTDIIIFRDRTLYYARSASVAGKSMTETISSELDVDFAKAENLKIEYGNLPLAEVEVREDSEVTETGSETEEGESPETGEKTRSEESSSTADDTATDDTSQDDSSSDEDSAGGEPPGDQLEGSEEKEPPPPPSTEPSSEQTLTSPGPSEQKDTGKSSIETEDVSGSIDDEFGESEESLDDSPEQDDTDAGLGFSEEDEDETLDEPSDSEGFAQPGEVPPPPGESDSTEPPDDSSDKPTPPDQEDDQAGQFNRESSRPKFLDDTADEESSSGGGDTAGTDSQVDDSSFEPREEEPDDTSSDEDPDLNLQSPPESDPDGDTTEQEDTGSPADRSVGSTGPDEDEFSEGSPSDTETDSEDTDWIEENPDETLNISKSDSVETEGDEPSGEPEAEPDEEEPREESASEEDDEENQGGDEGLGDLPLGDLRTPDEEEDEDDNTGLGAAANPDGQAEPPSHDFDQKALQDALKSQVDRLINELQQTFDYFQNEMDGDDVEQIVLCGSGCKIKNLPAYVEGELARETRRFDPLAKLNGVDPDNMQSMLVAAGLQLRSSPADSTLSINLLPEEIVRKRELKRRNQKLLANGVLAGILVLQVLVWLFYSYRVRKSYFVQSQNQLDKVQPIVQRVEELNSTQQDLQQRIAVIDDLEKKQARMLPILYGLMQFPEELKGNTWYENFSVSANEPYATLNLSGVTGDFQDASRLYGWLEERDFVVELTDQNQSRTTYTLNGQERSMVSFSVQLDITFNPETTVSDTAASQR